ncbi:MAG: TfoX/Sxy family protein [Polyangiaceae bacterium]|nr:TfoX/Sxy family protein [Polyangiaceae bacterium]
MVYSEALAARIRTLLGGGDDVVEKKMFGGIAFMVDGNMACGVLGEDLMARIGPDKYDEALARPHARPMDFTGRPLRNMVYVAPAGTRTAPMLERWVDESVAFARSRPAKKRAKKPAVPRSRSARKNRDGRARRA